MSHLKSHNQNLEDNIKKSKNELESPYRSNDNLEEEIKCIIKLIMDKDNMYTTANESKDHESRRQVTENMYTTANELQDVTLSGKCSTPKKIEFGWNNPFSFRKLCSALTSSYHHVATIMTKYTPRPKVKTRKILQ